MKTYNRKDKFDKMKEFLNSDAWIILREEILRLKLGKENSIDVFGESGEGNKIFFNTGCRVAFETVLNLPERIKNTNESIMTRLLKGEE
jgi:hypothetical protein